MKTTHTLWPALALFLGSCAPGPYDAAPPTAPQPLHSSNEAQPMATNGTTTTTRPPIDARAPQHLETATFALG